MQKQTPNVSYLMTTGAEKEEVMRNLDQVRSVFIEDRELRLVFSENHMVNITGSAYKELLGLLASNCIITDGTPLPEHLAKFKSQSPTVVPSPDQLQEP
jgi:hypothetical protein